MSYLGQTTLKASDIRRVDVTSSTSATHTLTWEAPNEQSLIVTINGVKQQNNYTVSGTTLTLDTALVATDALEVIGINDIGTTITPAEGSVNTAQLANDAVATAKIQDDAVTADKLANSINTEIAANTAKVTNATHTGDVTGATALTIANDAVDIAMLSATGTASASTFLRGDNAWSAVDAGTANKPNFQMRTAGDLAWVNSAYTKIPLATLMWESDTGSCDTTTNYRFTVPAAKGGKYILTHHMPLPDGGNGYVKILKNGAELGNFWYTWASNFGGLKTFSMTTSAELAAADYIEWWVYSNVNDTVNGDYYITGWRIDS